MTFNIDKARRFAGLLDNSRDAMLQGCFAAAKAWFKNAGVEDRDGDELYEYLVYSLMVWMMVRQGETDGDARIPEYIVTSVHQLRTCEPVVTI